MWQNLLSENAEEIARGLRQAIASDQASEKKVRAKLGTDYYKGKHDIQNNRIFYIDDAGRWREDRYASNIRIPHAFMTEIVDQKTQYLLGEPLTVELPEENGDKDFKARLDEYYDDDFMVFLQGVLDGASQKGFEYAYARTTAEDRLAFQVADALGIIEVYNDANELKRIVRYYDRTIVKDGKSVVLHKAEVWDNNRRWFFIAEDGKEFIPDPSQIPNPAPHIIAVADDGELAERDYGEIPFFKLKNNADERSDLEPIKDLIDDYDLMNAFLSNNLQDFADAVYVVKGFMGDDLSSLRQNIKSKKVVHVSDEGGVDIKTVTIPIEGRRAKMAIDRENIYRFGMAFDSTQIGDGNITNVVIKSRYALLDMKAMKAEIRLKALLKWINKMVVADINRRFGTAYDPAAVSFTLTRKTIVNESDLKQGMLLDAQIKQTLISTVLASASKLDDESVVRLICEQWELEYDEVRRRLEEQGVTPEFVEDTDPEEELIEPEGQQAKDTIISGVRVKNAADK
jgi:SPP1 family phage portal protein